MQRYMRGMSNGGSVSARGIDALTVEQLRHAVPSIFATEAHDSRSQRYSYIPTAEVLDGLHKEGFDPFFAQQSRTRIEGKQDFTKHMLRLRHRSRTTERDEAHEIILINAHDGTSSYQMMSGVFRFVCANGLFTGDTFGEVKVRHTGDAVSQVIDGAYTVLDDADKIMNSVNEMKAMTLSEDEERAFAKAAHALRFEDSDKAPIEPERLLHARRIGDSQPDAWSVFNRVQENVMRGGQRGWTRDKDNRPRRTSSREVKGIDQSKALNRALWTLAEELGRIKGGATPSVLTAA